MKVGLLAIAQTRGGELGAHDVVIHFMLDDFHVEAEAVLADRARSVESHFWIGAGVFHGHFFAITFHVGRRAVLLALLIHVGAVGIHIFLRHTLFERNRDGDAEYFRFGCVFVLPGLHVLGGGVQA